MKWNLSALPEDAVIQTATLELYLNEAGGDDPYEVSVHRIIGVDPVIEACTGETWDGSTAWTNGTALAQDNIESAAGVTAVDQAPGFKSWDVTGIAASWVEAPAENYGMLLNADTTAAQDSFRYFASSQAADSALRPKLTVTFVTEQQPDLPPRANAAADKLSGKAPLAVNFNAEGSHDAENSLSYAWDFGDGSDTATGITASHEYTTAGTYQAVLTVTDSAGQSDTEELTIEVADNQAPVAAAQADVTAGEAPLTVLFDAGTSTDSDGSIVTYSWDFDSDGVEDAEGMTVEHTFTEAGEYHVTLTVTDDSGAAAQDTGIVISVTSNVPPEIADFTATPDVLDNPRMQATFNASVSDPDGDAVTVLIDCGNGQTATELPAVCTYNQASTYTVTLTADDVNGNHTTATLTMVVNDAVPAKPFNVVLTAN
jgi:PKD repeat protein